MKLFAMLERHLTSLNPRDRRALFIVTVFLMTVGGYVYVLEPLIVGYQDAHSAITELSEKQRRYRRQVTLLPRRESKLAEYTSELQAIERRFDFKVANPEAAVSRTITELTYYARLVEVTVRSIRPLDAVNNGDYLEIPFELEATGDYENLRKFFYYIDTSPSLLAITDLDLTVQSEGLLQARLKLSDVISVQNEEPAVVAGTIAPQNRLRLILSRWTGYAPLVVAKANGYLDTDSLSVDFLYIDDSVTLQRLLSSGEVDAIGTSLPALLEHWANGIPLSIVMPLGSTVGTEGIVVRQDSQIRSVADLEYQRVAADDQGLLQFVLFQALNDNGMNLGDIELQPLAASQVARDMSSGSLEVGVTREPYLSALIENKTARLIYASDDTHGPILDFLAITPVAEQQKPGAIQLLVNGLHQGQKFMDEQPEKAIAIVAQWQGQTEQVTSANLVKITRFDHDETIRFFAEDQLSNRLNYLEDYFNASDKPFPLLTRDDIISDSFFQKLNKEKAAVESDE